MIEDARLRVALRLVPAALLCLEQGCRSSAWKMERKIAEKKTDGKNRWEKKNGKWKSSHWRQTEFGPFSGAWADEKKSLGD